MMLQPRRARVVAHLEGHATGAVLIIPQQSGPAGIGVDIDRAAFPDAEFTAVLSNPDLAQQGGAFRLFTPKTSQPFQRAMDESDWEGRP